MSNVIFYSNGCPKCNVLKEKLELKNVEFTQSENLEELKSMGFMSLPILKVGNKYLEFLDAVKWVNAYRSEDI